jgi:hypothetical protein
MIIYFQFLPGEAFILKKDQISEKMAGKKNFIRPLTAAIYENKNCLVDFLILRVLFQCRGIGKFSELHFKNCRS